MKFLYEQNRIYLTNESGRMVAQVTFPADGPGRVNISETFVDGLLRGQGIGAKLMEETAELLRRENRKARVSCSYAAKWFERHPEYGDLLEREETAGGGKNGNS